LLGKINEIKDREYGENRKCGICVAKRKKGIIPEDYDEEVRRKVAEFMRQHPEKFNSRQRVVTKSMIDAYQRALAR